MSRSLVAFGLFLMAGQAAQAATTKNPVTVTVRADGTVSVQADVPVADLTARLRMLLPDPTATPVRLRVNGGVDLAHLRRIERALEAAGVKSVLSVTGAAVQPPSSKQPSPSAATPPAAGPVPASITVQVDETGRTSIGDTVLPLDGLATDLIARAQGDRSVPVVLRGTPTTAYGGMVSAMEAVIAAGFQNVAILDDPVPGTPAVPAAPKNSPASP